VEANRDLQACQNIVATNINITNPSGKVAQWTCKNVDKSTLAINCVWKECRLRNGSLDGIQEQRESFENNTSAISIQQNYHSLRVQTERSLSNSVAEAVNFWSVKAQKINFSIVHKE
jgi:hypothetical protein